MDTPHPAEAAADRFETVGADAAETQAAIRRILLIARADEGALLLVVAAMVLKPFT